ncbi:hypothetical protein GGS23DRAFT_574729 [Durotheca rogersii]|uniref:uncharacterized protein n=1 Tax=Durotheca rogersii TaxID=419775 RepID=UPI00221ECBF3|nr:uncharacterized protein GGS23DRAFT_574729 [Durotheca rogersii]KAI5861744.1 hypothetical protein GGS23DRAFT_574729 [Durotheca rogersii]
MVAKTCLRMRQHWVLHLWGMWAPSAGVLCLVFASCLERGEAARRDRGGIVVVRRSRSRTQPNSGTASAQPGQARPRSAFFARIRLLFFFPLSLGISLSRVRACLF